MNNFKSIREIMRESKSCSEMAEIAKNRFLEKGYIFNEVVGWINPKELERCGLDPNMTAIPAQLYDDLDYKEVITEEKDYTGRKTGNKTVEKVPYKTGKKVWCANENYFSYLHEKERKSMADYANFKNSERLSE